MNEQAQEQDQEQGEIVPSDELQAKVVKESGQVNETANDNLNNLDNSGQVMAQPAADNPDAPLTPDYTGTMDTSDT